MPNPSATRIIALSIITQVKIAELQYTGK